MALRASTNKDDIPAEHIIIEDEPNDFAESLFRGGGTETVVVVGGGGSLLPPLSSPPLTSNFKHSKSITNTDTFSFTPDERPTPTEIRRWMIESQNSLNKVVTNWQSSLIQGSYAVSSILEELALFVSNLDNESTTSPSSSSSTPTSSSTAPPPSSSSSILTSKLQNNTGTFESTMNIYLHVILLAIKKVIRTISKSAADHHHHHTTARRRKQEKLLTGEERQKFLAVLTQFTFVAEDALKFLHMHEKYLAPACSGIISMRNDLYKILRTVNAEPLGKIIPIMGTVLLEEIRRNEDTAWIKKLAKQRDQKSSRCPSFFEVMVGSRHYSFLVQQQQSQQHHSSRDVSGSSGHVSDRYETEVRRDDGNSNNAPLEGLELVEILLKQLSTCIQSSMRSCKECQVQLSQIGTQLWKTFYTLLTTLKAERRKERLQPENCSESLKYSLCNLEVKFHQVEKLLEEIPDHLRRIVGICDECCMLLMTGLGDEFHDIFEEEWSSSPVKDIAEEYFKSRRRFFHGCFPFLWRVIVKVFLGLSGNSGGGSSGGSGSNRVGGYYYGSTDKKLKEFWELVQTEMEQFQKELKAKELESDYSILLTIPISSRSGQQQQENEYSQTLPNYLHHFLRHKISNDRLSNDGG